MGSANPPKLSDGGLVTRRDEVTAHRGGAPGDTLPRIAGGIVPSRRSDSSEHVEVLRARVSAGPEPSDVSSCPTNEISTPPRYTGAYGDKCSGKGCTAA